MSDRREAATEESALDIGLVNFMPDAALHAAERQFTSLLQESTPDIKVRVHLFAGPGVARSAFTASQMRGRYQNLDRLDRIELDALVMTGAEPREADIRDEGCWPSLVRLVEWAAARSTPSLWSCLAAHAAVLALDGVQRRRLEQKRTGVFSWQRLGEDPDLPGLPPAGISPHSRLNDLAEERLVAGGYSILTRSAEAGVELFAKRVGGKFVFLQGHPEYDADTLLRECRRDFGRWARGEAPDPPLPRRYFPRSVEKRLRGLASAGPRRSSHRFPEAVAEALRGFAPAPSWRRCSLDVFGSFVRMVAVERQANRRRPGGAVARRA